MSIEADARLTASVLDKCILFEALGGSARLALLARSKKRRYDCGDVVFHASDPGDSMMAVLSGIVRVSRSTAEGKEIILNEIGSGGILGELAVLDGRGRSADAVALTNCELLIINRHDALAFLESHPAACLKLLALLCGKLRASDERTTDIAFAGLEYRLAKLIVKRTEGTSARSVPRLSMQQSELARMVGSTREAVNRQLKSLERRGLIRIEAGWIVVHNRDRLAAVGGGDSLAVQ